ncbi:MAG: hypothetical protein HY341_01905, partial [Candidatus Kerfeldbacteria bacterium]|nr:hypothetical protein [Candidatus Kerfeldbacteria bacterium]
MSFEPEDADLEATGDGPYPQGDIPELRSAARERGLEEQAKKQQEEAFKDRWGPMWKDQGFWGNMKRDFRHTMKYGPIQERLMMVTILATFGSFGASEVQRVAEYARMHQKEKQLQVEKADLEQRLTQKKGRIRELFGPHAHFSIPEEDKLDAEQDLLAAQRAKFTFVPVVEDPDARRRYNEAKYRVERLETPEADAEDEMTEIKTGIVGENYGFEEVRMSREQFQDYATRTFPKGWVNNEVVSIEQTDVQNPMPERYGIKGESAATWHRGRDTLVFDGASRDDNIGWVLRECLPHELGHANDWQSDNEMSGEERLDLLLAVGDRLGSEDRFRSSYVERINNPDEQQERYTKAVEYWAEICAQYFRNPEAMDIKDYQLVDARVRAVDPDYDADECREERQQMV